jgi:hypothetical protein
LSQVHPNFSGENIQSGKTFTIQLKVCNFIAMMMTWLTIIYQSTKETIQGLDAQYFYIEKKKSTQIVYFRFIWA